MSLSTESYQAFIDVMHEDLIETRGQRDELLAALRAMVATFHRTGTSEKMNAYLTAHEVIAKTEGGEE